MKRLIAAGLAAVAAAVLSGCMNIAPVTHHHYYNEAPGSDALAEAEAEAPTEHADTHQHD